jgi:hypothetical protein
VPCLYAHDNTAVDLRRRRFADANSHSDSYVNSYADSYGNSNSHVNSYADCNGNSYRYYRAEVHADAQAATHATSTPISSSV